MVGLVAMGPAARPRSLAALPSTLQIRIASHLPDARSLLSLRLACKALDRTLFPAKRDEHNLLLRALQKELALPPRTNSIALSLLEEQTSPATAMGASYRSRRPHQFLMNHRAIEYQIRLFKESCVTADETWRAVTQSEEQRLREAFYRLMIYSTRIARRERRERDRRKRQRKKGYAYTAYSSDSGTDPDDDEDEKIRKRMKRLQTSLAYALPGEKDVGIDEMAPMVCVAAWFQRSFDSWPGEGLMDAGRNFHSDVFEMVRARCWDETTVKPLVWRKAVEEGGGSWFEYVDADVREVVNRAATEGFRDSFVEVWVQMVGSLRGIPEVMDVLEAGR